MVHGWLRVQDFKQVVIITPMSECMHALRVQGSGFRDQGSGIRVQGSGFRDQGSGKVLGYW